MFILFLPKWMLSDLFYPQNFFSFLLFLVWVGGVLGGVRGKIALHMRKKKLHGRNAKKNLYVCVIIINKKMLSSYNSHFHIFICQCNLQFFLQIFISDNYSQNFRLYHILRTFPSTVLPNFCLR